MLALTNESKHDTEQARHHGLGHGCKEASKFADQPEDDGNDGPYLDDHPASHSRNLHGPNVLLHQPTHVTTKSARELAAAPPASSLKAAA